jgi:uncharacterized BrkB/YihY/UPF0761 family membrane protein
MCRRQQQELLVHFFTRLVWVFAMLANVIAGWLTLSAFYKIGTATALGAEEGTQAITIGLVSVVFAIGFAVIATCFAWSFERASSRD